MKSDEDIMLGVRKGDWELIAELHYRYRSKVYDYFYRMTRDVHSSNDLTQILFYKLIKYHKTFQVEGSFESWIFKMSSNLLCDEFKKKTKQRVLFNSFVKENPWDNLSDNQHQNDHRLFKALDKLPSEQRELIVLHYFKKMSYRSIADIKGTTEGAIKTKTYRAMIGLRKSFFNINIGVLEDEM